MLRTWQDRHSSKPRHKRRHDLVLEQQRHPFVERQNEGIEASACRRSLLDMRGLLPQKVGENKGHNARRVHWRTRFSENCTDTPYLMLTLSTFSEWPDRPFAGKER